MPVRVTTHHARVAAFLGSPTGDVARTFLRYGRRVEAGAKRRCNVRTGVTRASITMEYEISPTRIRIVVGSHSKVFLWLNIGTGIHGPRRRPIRPKRGRVLVFEGRDGELVFTPEVKGIKPNPILIDALRDAVPWPVRKNPIAPG